MSITYYYAPMSTAVRATWAIEELGVPCERLRVDDLGAAMQILDNALAGKSYLVDDKFSLADLAVSSYLGWLGFMGYDYASFKNVKAWGDRCLGRPAAVKTNAPS